LTREALLQEYGQFYGEQHFAVTFTSTTVGDDAKRVTTRGWDKTAPLADGPFGAALLKGRGEQRNPAIVLRPSNLIVLECDTEDDLARIEQLNLPATLTVRSSQPYKRHYYFRPAPELEALPYVAFRFETGKLTADTGRYFLAPPSIHPSGAVYDYISHRGPHDVEIATLPEPIYRDLAQQARIETTELRDAIAEDPEAKIQAGNRRDLIFRYACMLRRWGIPRAQILEQCHQFNETRCVPPVDRALVAVQVEGAMKKTGGQEITAGAKLNGSAPDEQERDSWTPINLNALPEHPPVQPTLGSVGLVYPGKRHVFSGPQETAKTLAAYAIGLEVVRQNGTLILIDFEMGAWDARNRLRELGAQPNDLDRIHYLEPSDPATDRTMPGLLTLHPALVIVDAAAGAYDLQGLDDNKRQDVERFTRLYVRAFWKAGVATIVLDHVVKNTETRGKYAVGSERKVGGADVHLGFEVISPISRGSRGLYKIVTHKDRGGFLKRGNLANMELDSDPDTHQITWEFKPADSDEGDGWRGPTRLMEKVSAYLDKHPEGASRTHLEEAIMGRAGYVRKAMDALIARGYVAETPGPRNARILTNITSYSEKDEETSPRPTPSHPVPDGVNSPRPTPSPSTEGTGRGDANPDGVTPSQWTELFLDTEPDNLPAELQEPT
jgi:hypothetical protein